MQYWRKYISRNLTKLREDETIFEIFESIVMQLDLGIEQTDLKKIHLRTAEYAFRAYTKQRNNDKCNKIKALLSDKTNLALQRVIQTGGKDGKEDLVKSQEDPQIDAQLMKSFGLKVKA